MKIFDRPPRKKQERNKRDCRTWAKFCLFLEKDGKNSFFHTFNIYKTSVSNYTTKENFDDKSIIQSKLFRKANLIIFLYETTQFLNHYKYCEF